MGVTYAWRFDTGPLATMETAKVHAKSDGLAEWVFNTCRSGYYRIAEPE